jgi:hypothetical protein
MRIDTDLITYLSHVILPEQLVQSHLANQWQNQQNLLQHAICEEEETPLLEQVNQNSIEEELLEPSPGKQGATLQFYEEDGIELPVVPRGGKKQLFLDESDDDSPLAKPPAKPK